MKIYGLAMHFKQGDDFGAHLERTSTASEALRNWATDFAQRRDVCERLAAVLEGKKITVNASVHTIEFIPKDREARLALESLVKADLLYVESV